MLPHDPFRLSLTTRDIERFRNGLDALEYSRFKAKEREILVIRSPSLKVSLVEDLELMVEMIDIEDALGLDEAYLIGDEDYEPVAPEILTNIASARLRIEKGYLEKYGPILLKEYSSKEFIDPKDPLELLRLIVRVPLKESEYISTPLAEIISHVYIPNDISIVFLMLEDSYRRIIKDDIVAAKAEKERPKRKAKIESLPESLSPKEWDEEAWLLNELARIGLPQGSEVVQSHKKVIGDESPADIDGHFPEGSIKTGEILALPAPKGKMDNMPEPGGIDRNDVSSFPKYTHKESRGKDTPEAFIDNIFRNQGEKQEIVETFPVAAHPSSDKGRTGKQFPENTLDKYASIMEKLKMDGIQFHEVEGIEKTILIQRNDRTRILATYTKKCEIEDMVALEKNVAEKDADLGLMISLEFSYDSKLFVVGRDLDLLKWDVFLNDGLVVEPSWFY